MNQELIVQQNLKLALHNINILDVKLKYSWHEELGNADSIIIQYEYKYEGFMDESEPNMMSTGWRKSSVEVFGRADGVGYNPPTVYDAIECVYEIATATQAELAKRFEDR